MQTTVDSAVGLDGITTDDLIRRECPFDVVIIDGAPFIREALAGAFVLDDRFAVAGTYATSSDAIAGIRRGKVDAAIIDGSLLDGNGIELVLTLRAVRHDVAVLVFTDCEQPGKAQAVLDAGARGYITKRQTFGELADAVVTVCNGGTAISNHIAGALVEEQLDRKQSRPSAECVLSPIECTVLRLIADGKTDAEIGNELFVSIRTIQNHLARIRRNTGLHRRAELVRWATEKSWL